MHPIEKAFQAWAHIEMPMVGTTDELRESYERSYGDPLPPNIVVPRVAIISHIRKRITKAAKMGFKLSTQDKHRIHQAANNAATWFAYREDKSIFVPTKEILKALLTCPSPMDVPLNSLTLPRRCCFFDLSALSELEPTDFPPEFNRTPYIAIINDIRFGSNTQDYDATDKQIPSFTALRLVPAPKSYGAPPGYALMEPLVVIPAHLEGATIESSCRNAIKNRYRKAMELLESHGHKELPSKFAYVKDLVDGTISFADYYPMMALLVNLVLYLNGDPEIVKHVHPGPRPVGVSPSKWNYKKKVAKPVITPVGERFTAAIQHWEIESKRECPKGKGGSKRPHCRKPHPHRYWIGTGEDKTVVIRNLDYISVHDFPIPVHAESPTVVLTPIR